MNSTLLKSLIFMVFVAATLQVDHSVIVRANSLIGKSRSEYVCNQVVNYALYGHKNGMLASGFLHYGHQVNSPQAGDVVVARDGSHVGIFVSGHEFIHSSSSRYQVIKVGSDQLKYVFPSGYQIRRN